MVEFHVQEYANREKITIGLINSGYTVRVVERPDPNRYLGKLYFIQTNADTNMENPVINKDSFKTNGETPSILKKGEEVTPSQNLIK